MKFKWELGAGAGAARKLGDPRDPTKSRLKIAPIVLPNQSDGPQ